MPSNKSPIKEDRYRTDERMKEVGERIMRVSDVMDKRIRVYPMRLGRYRRICRGVASTIFLFAIVE
jgi:hypothetical protein